MQHIDLSYGESIRIGDAIVKVVGKEGWSARIGVKSPRHIRIEMPDKPKPQQKCMTISDRLKERAKA